MLAACRALGIDAIGFEQNEGFKDDIIKVTNARVRRRIDDW